MSTGGEIVLKKSLIAGSIAALCASVGVGAQSSTDPQQNPTQAQQPTTQAPGETKTLVGCVYRESDIPGRKAGVMEDFILADATEVPPSGQTGATGTAGVAGKMYKLEQIADERLREMVGKRVEVTGRMSAARPTGTTGAPETQPEKIELPEFDVTSIREVEGTCPPKPSPRQ